MKDKRLSGQYASQNAGQQQTNPYGNTVNKQSQGTTTGKSFAVFDIDGTLIRWQLYHAIADKLVKLGHINEANFQQIKEARMSWKRREHPNAYKDYELQLVKLYTNIMLGINKQQFDETVDAVFSEYKEQVYAYTRDLIRQLKDLGYVLFAISGSHQAVIEKLASHYGFDDVVGRVDEEKNGIFTGKSTTPIFDKNKVLQQLVSKHKVVISGSWGVGDSQSDIKMLEMVENPIAFNPEKELFEHAKAKGWKIVIERKNMVYQLEMLKGVYVLAETNKR